jgi:hypothetical protein
MTDIEAQFGPFRAVLCEWSHPEPCLKPVAETRAYCPECMTKAYQPAKPKKKK